MASLLQFSLEIYLSACVTRNLEFHDNNQMQQKAGIAADWIHALSEVSMKHFLTNNRCDARSCLRGPITTRNKCSFLVF